MEFNIYRSPDEGNQCGLHRERRQQNSGQTVRFVEQPRPNEAALTLLKRATVPNRLSYNLAVALETPPDTSNVETAPCWRVLLGRKRQVKAWVTRVPCNEACSEISGHAEVFRRASRTFACAVACENCHRDSGIKSAPDVHSRALREKACTGLWTNPVC